MSEATIEYKDGPNVSTAYAVSEGKKTKVQMVATPAGDLELAENPNVDTGYIVIDGKKHKCALVAEVAGELKLPTSATDDTGYVIAQDGRQHKVKLVANIAGGGGGTTINNQDIDVTENGVYTADTGYTGLGTVNVNVPNPSTGILSIVENGSYNVTEYATAEVNVPTSGGATTKYGVSIDNLLGDVDENGKLYVPYDNFVFNGAGIKSLDASVLAYRFTTQDVSKSLPITKILLPDLLQAGTASLAYVANSARYLTEVDLGLITDISSSSELSHAFEDASNLATVRAPNVTTISGAFACQNAFSSTGLTSNAFPNLTTISGDSACQYMYRGCTFNALGLDNLTTISGESACKYMFNLLKIDVAEFPKLTTITGSQACRYWFQLSTVKKVYFPALTTVDTDVFGSSAARGAFGSCSQLTEIHFRADAQATIEAMSGYAAKWGASSASIFFDL